MKKVERVNFNNITQTNKHLLIDKNKTTNINILLNRVKSNKKKDFKNKVFFVVSLLTLISIIGFVSLL